MLIHKALGLLLSLTMVGPSAAAGTLEGIWGGPGIRLRVEAGQGHIETECATGTMNGPMALDANGQFQADGVFASHGGGPQRADAGPLPAARYLGRLSGGFLTLDVLPADGAALRFELRAGANPKFVRCL